MGCVGGERVRTFLTKMMNRVAENVGDRRHHLSGSGQCARVIVIGKDLALHAEQAVDFSRDPNREALHPSRERTATIRFDDEVQVIPHHREFNEAQAVPATRGNEALANDREPAGAAQARHMISHPQRHVGRQSLSELRSCGVADECLRSLRFASRATPLSSAQRQTERKLGRLLHSRRLPQGYDNECREMNGDLSQPTGVITVGADREVMPEGELNEQVANESCTRARTEGEVTVLAALTRTAPSRAHLPERPALHFSNLQPVPRSRLRRADRGH